MVPISAHALFAGPLVISPTSLLAIEVLGGPAVGQSFAGVLWCDGRRRVDLPAGARIEVRRGATPVLLARLRGGDDAAAGGAPFTDRLVAKFGLPVTGWRGGPGAPPNCKAPRALSFGRRQQSARPGPGGRAGAMPP